MTEVNSPIALPSFAFTLPMQSFASNLLGKRLILSEYQNKPYTPFLIAQNEIQRNATNIFFIIILF